MERRAATANSAIDRGLISASRRALRQDGLDRTVTTPRHWEAVQTFRGRFPAQIPVLEDLTVTGLHGGVEQQ